MKRFAEGVVKGRYILFLIMMVVTIISAINIPNINVITDMTEYLPDDSSMKQGLTVLEEEFPDVSLSSSQIRVMTTDLDDEKMDVLLGELQNLDGIDSITYDAESEDYNKDGHSLIVLSVDYDYDSEEFEALEDELSVYCEEYGLVYDTGSTTVGDIPAWIFILAFGILMVVLFVMCESWVEPFLFLFTILAAIVINMGTNALLSGVSSTTNQIAAILQLILSMDYSIILINRYRQEQANYSDKKEAMAAAIKGAVVSIASSSLTTVVGLLALLFMSFKIGPDMGVVLAKGVVISLICIITMLPALILFFDKAIEKTAKKVLHINMDLIAKFSYKCRYAITACFVVVLAVLFVSKSGTKLFYTMSHESEVEDVFPSTNSIVLLYDNDDEEAITALAEELSDDESVKSITSYGTTVGKSYTAEEMTVMLSSMTDTVSSEMVSMLYMNAGTDTMTIYELFDVFQQLASNEMYAKMLDPTMLASLSEYSETLETAKNSLVGENYSLMLISTTYALEGEETTAFMDRLTTSLDADTTGNYYLMGNTPMAYEMSLTFNDELNKVSLITAAAIFVVVMISFMSLSVPLILVLLIETAVFAVMTLMTVTGSGLYYLALIIVQSLLMGATIDYGILYTNCYIEERRNKDVLESLKACL